jgi:hypothetical protein
MFGPQSAGRPACLPVLSTLITVNIAQDNRNPENHKKKPRFRGSFTRSFCRIDSLFNKTHLSGNRFNKIGKKEKNGRIGCRLKRFRGETAFNWLRIAFLRC